MIRISIGALTVLAGICACKAATITVAPLQNSEVYVIGLEGLIGVGDFEQFKQKAFLINKAVVVLNSDGGVIGSAISIGEMIRLKGFGTAVLDNMSCASACALIWLGGTPRLIGPTAHVGFHAAYNAQSGKVTSDGNALVGSYLNKIGLPDKAIAYVTHAAPASMTWGGVSV